MTVVAPPPLIDADRLAEAWEIGRRHGSRMKFYAPALKRFATSEWAPLPRFASISLTGADCALQCNHCKAKVLETMYPARRPDELWELAVRLDARGTRGALITGGSARNGTVPFLPHLDVIRRIREELGWRIVVHSGVADDGSSRASRTPASTACSSTCPPRPRRCARSSTSTSTPSTSCG